MRFQTPTGMRDIFGKDFAYFKKIEYACKEMADFYGFNRIEPPILEDSALFEKGTGITTDIVQKQMFNLKTRGGDRLTLRPELTPSIVRAYIQHGMQAMPKPVELWYFSPVFRYERPQAGRFRQFHQFGFESLGNGSPVIDAHIIQITYNTLKNLGFNDLIIEVNSIGDWQCRPYYKKSLLNYLRKQKNFLCSDCERRFKENPLRILDCKQAKCQKVVSQAPQIIDHLCKECHNHFKQVLEFLDELELPYKLNSYLVRGLDYYTKTVFEIFQDNSAEESIAQGALCGGGRYDELIKLLGGKETSACGVACGVERIMALLKSKKVKKIQKPDEAKIFLAQVGELAKKKALILFEEFRKAKIKTKAALHKNSLSSQIELADSLKVSYSLILGQKEALSGEIIIREMNTGRQKIVKLDKVVAEIKRRLKK